MRRLFPVIFVLSACASEDDLGSATQSLATLPKVTVLFSVRGTAPVLVTTRDLTPDERRAHEASVSAAAGTGVAELSCSSGGGCNEQGCWSWAICHGDGVVAVARCTTTSGCSVDVYD